MKIHRLSFPIAALVLAACAPAHVPWSNPQVPKDQWARDWSDCKRNAENAALGYGGRDSLSDAPFRDYDRAAAKAQIAGSTAACMSALGYVPAKQGE
ncbi:MAG: hypothetical protein M0006_11090 [Magnetospirillum sp.]|nr:hypothetical protein [Magnetospirillum sp.]